MTIVIIPVGSLRQRHIDGLRHLLTEYWPVRKLYVLFNAEEKDTDKPLSVKKNAEEVALAFSGLNPEIIPTKTTDVEDISRTFTEILLREGLRLSDVFKENVLIDISSTTKQMIVVSTLFASLFGIKVYYVKGKRKKDIRERVESVFNELFNSKEKKEKIVSILDDKNNIELRTEKLKQLLIEEVAKITYNLSAQSEAAEKAPLEIVPFTKDLTEFKEDDELVLTTILEMDGSVNSIAELHRRLNEKIELSTLTYRVGKLVNWGLIEAAGKRAKQLVLTPVGRGIAKGLLKMAKPLFSYSSTKK